MEKKKKKKKIGMVKCVKFSVKFMISGVFDVCKNIPFASLIITKSYDRYIKCNLEKNLVQIKPVVIATER